MARMVQIEKVGVTFETTRGPFVALRDIDLTVDEGEVVSLIGHTGCGKTTLLNLIAGLNTPSEGVLWCNDREIAGAGPERVVVFHNDSLLPWLTCFDNVYLAVERMFGGKEGKDRLNARTRRALAMVHMSDAEQKFPDEMSSGMKQRVGIARAFAMEPRILLMDEPFAGLDALTRASLQDELMGVMERTGTTVMMVPQDVDEAVLLSDRIVMMTDGPAATIGRVLEVELPWPRDRLKLVHDPTFAECRAALLEFLYQKQLPKAA